MKKLVCFILAVGTVMVLCACGIISSDSTTGSDVTVTTAASAVSTTAATVKTESTSAVTTAATTAATTEATTASQTEATTVATTEATTAATTEATTAATTGTTAAEHSVIFRSFDYKSWRALCDDIASFTNKEKSDGKIYEGKESDFGYLITSLYDIKLPFYDYTSADWRRDAESVSFCYTANLTNGKAVSFSDWYMTFTYYNITTKTTYAITTQTVDAHSYKDATYLYGYEINGVRCQIYIIKVGDFIVEVPNGDGYYSIRLNATAIKDIDLSWIKYDTIRQRSDDMAYANTLPHSITVSVDGLDESYILTPISMTELLRDDYINVDAVKLSSASQFKVSITGYPYLEFIFSEDYAEYYIIDIGHVDGAPETVYQANKDTLTVTDSAGTYTPETIFGFGQREDNTIYDIRYFSVIVKYHGLYYAYTPLTVEIRARID